MTTKLDFGQKHLLRLIEKEQACQDGWAPVSKAVFKLVQSLPAELLELHSVGDDGKGRARLTLEGQSILNAMAWL